MDMMSNDSKVIRAPSLRRGKNDERLCDRIKLKKVLGLTVCSNAALDVSPTNGVLAYPAGCTVVLFNTKKLTQSYLLNTSRKAITAVAYSQCGRYIATGECGINPAIKVWELETQNGNSDGGAGGTVVAEFLGHKYAVSCVAFSPTGKYLVSVGSQHDMIVNVFDWKLNLKIASNKVSAKVAAVSFSEDGNYFVTVGNRHVKYWYLEGSRKYKEPIPLMGRSAILGELRNNDFCAVACGKGERSESTYAITRIGHLVEFNSRRLLDKWVACRTALANCICVNSNYILVGCAESIVRIFNAATLEYITTLPRTHYLGVDVAQGIHINHIMAVPVNAKYPDTIAMVFDEGRSKVTCVYNDHSLYIWDLRDIRRVGKSHSFLYHSACIWGVESVPYNLERNLSQTLPEDCFLTCSSDDTIRVWGLEGCGNNEIYRKNIYSKELLKVVYIDDELNFIKDIDNPILNTDKSSSYDGRNGVRCIKISPERYHLATGDRSGNIRIYNLNNLKMLTMIEAHDSEVLCLEYTNDKIDKKLLASASRDRLIHVFDVNQGYKILQTLDDHSSSITSVKYIGSGMNFQMISCGADKSIMFRNYQNGQFLRGTNCSGKTTLYDMEVDSNSKHILTACQDRNIRVYATQNSKHTKTFKGSHSDDGSLIKLCLDPSGIYVATSCTDKTLSVYDYYSNECMARMYGHSELVTGLKFTNNCKYLISASGDGCIFIWQVPHDMIVTMQARLSQQRLRSGQPPIARAVSNPVTEIIVDVPPRERDHEKFSSSPNHLFTDDIPLTPGYKFSDVGQLPQWAKRKGNEDSQMSSTNLSSSPSQGQVIPKARGRWAQRGQIDSDVLDFRSTLESPLSTNYNISSINNLQTSDYNSGSSKDIYNHTYLSEDSSIDSGMENRRDLFVEKLVSEQKKSRFEANNDNDGDVEDISDGERTSSDHGMMFYPTAAPATPTDFKVNAMNEDELRKSVRRQKFEKGGLCLNAVSHNATSTGTGTGTSDTEDEGSTPSGENADRSLASTLGGSFESIPQQTSSSFLQAALDGPGHFPERGDRSRRSISAKHNTENKSTSYSKSYTNSKKEELLKVINEAKQKLENVGYRSNLRGSQSISDLSHTGNSGVNRISRTGEVFPSTNTNSNYHYFNCAAPRSILTQNCNTIRQLHRNYPPYPRDVGLYTTIQANISEELDEKDIQPKLRPATLELPPSSLSASTGDTNKMPAVVAKSKRSSSILKNYKSCPVSPVHEELEWSNLPIQSKNIIFNEPKRHSMYSDDAKTILDMIHSDTEKMIEEITKKYGDLDNYRSEISKTELDCSEDASVAIPEKLEKSHNEKPKQSEVNEFGFLSEEEGNFSSDSLEDCSLDLDVEKHPTNPFKKRKTVCKKHQRIQEEKPKTLPKRSASDYFIYEEFYQNRYRNISLSDILNKGEDNKENQFLETQRHSSASFFLVQYPEQKSQESILSDDFSGLSYYNSMESILSDESDCKSAPLEVLFIKNKKDKCPGPSGIIFEKAESSSKSYGSSPNASVGFDCYMQQKLLNIDYQFDVTGYNLEGFSDNNKPFKPRSPRSVNRRNCMVNSETFPRFPDFSTFSDDIPTMSYKNAQYTSGVNKSLSKEFANQRQVNNSNPLYIKTVDNDFFVKKPVNSKLIIPAKSAVQRNDFGENSNVYIMKKSCSFEIEMKDGKGRFSNPKRFERNLEKFEKEQESKSLQLGGTLEMNYVPHKPPVAARRSSSMRSRSRSRTKERYNTVDQINYSQQPEQSTTANEARNFVNKDFLSKNQNRNNEEKSFEIYISEKGNDEDDNMDSLELYAKPNSHKNNSVDSLDELHDKQLKNSQNEKTCLPSSSSLFCNDFEFSKFKDIEKKINVINKLVEMEENKLEQERILKENRMKPFECNASQKGYVKSLTMNFDKLAKSIEEEIEFERKCTCRIKRNYSLPDVLEGAKFQAFQLDEQNFSDDAESEKIKDDFSEKDKGNPKSLLSVHIDDSSIRRACSLSDLSMGKGSKINSSAPQKPIPSSRSSIPMRPTGKRNSAPNVKNAVGMGTRSISVGVLNQSDSETDSFNLRGGILRPTVSSQNRSNVSGGNSRVHGPKNSTTNSTRRKGLQSSYSSVNLSTTGQDDSSSEEAQNNPNTHTGKPVVPPRPRSMITDHKKSILTNSNIAKNRGSSFESLGDFPSRDSDSTSSDLTSHCSNIINMLNTTTNAVLQLHTRLKYSEGSSGTRNNNLMLKELENAVIMTQNMLTRITSNKTENNPHVSFAPDQSGLENGDYLVMMNRCADILNKVRSKHKSDDFHNET